MRGLKYKIRSAFTCIWFVAPYTGAWIEIGAWELVKEKKKVAPYTGAWIEIHKASWEELVENGRTLHGCVD